MNLTDLYVEWIKMDDNRVRYHNSYCLCGKHYEEFFEEEGAEIYHWNEREAKPDYGGHNKVCDFCE